MERTFDIKRVGLLLTRQLTIPLKTIVITAGAVAAILLTIGILVAKFGDSTYTQGEYMGLAFVIFFIGGFIITSVVFAELNNPHRGYLYLMTPATTLEKLFVAWITTSLLYTIGSMAFLMIVNFLIYVVSEVMGLNVVELVNIFNYHDSLRIFLIYMSAQTFFLVGAIHFKKAHFLKTILALFILALIILGYISLYVHFIFGEAPGVKINLLDPKKLYSMDEQQYSSIVWTVVSFSMLIVSYFKLKEREV